MAQCMCDGHTPAVLPDISRNGEIGSFAIVATSTRLAIAKVS